MNHGNNKNFTLKNWTRKISPAKLITFFMLLSVISWGKSIEKKIFLRNFWKMFFLKKVWPEVLMTAKSTKQKQSKQKMVL